MEKKLSITAAIAQARKEVTENYTWSASHHAWMSQPKPAGRSKVDHLKLRRAAYALELLGVDEYEAWTYVNSYGPASFIELVRNYKSSWANRN